MASDKDNSSRCIVLFGGLISGFRVLLTFFDILGSTTRQDFFLLLFFYKAADTITSSIMVQKDSFSWIVVGAGPGGVAVLGNLLSNGVDEKDVIWVDPTFTSGNLNDVREVPR